jgi:hypothetical protein
VGLLARLQAWLPTGSTLPPEMWRRRHVWMVRVLWAHAVALFAWGLLIGNPLWHSAIDAGPIFLCGAFASRDRYTRRGRSAAACIGLLTASAVIVHLMNGAIE